MSSLGSGFSDALVATLMVFFGVSTLSAPYAITEAGVVSLFTFLVIGGLYGLSLLFMVKTIDQSPSTVTVERYQQLPVLAFGRKGHIVTLLLYIETAATLVGFLVSFGDIITYILPGVQHHFRVWATALLCTILLPTTWTHNMTKINYLSYVCAGSLLVIMVCIGVDAAIHGVHLASLQLLVWRKVPKALGIYSFGFGSAPVLPSVYTSMEDRSQFRKVMMWSFVGFIVIFAAFGVLGAMRFGDNTKSIVLLSLPRHAIIAKVAISFSFLIPITKFTVLLSPITADINQFCRNKFPTTPNLATCLGSSLMVFIIMTVAVLLPKFAGVIELVGAGLDMALGVILPPIFYLQLFKGHLLWTDKLQALLVVTMGVALAVMGTFASFQDLIN